MMIVFEVVKGRYVFKKVACILEKKFPTVKPTELEKEIIFYFVSDFTDEGTTRVDW